MILPYTEHDVDADDSDGCTGSEAGFLGIAVGSGRMLGCAGLMAIAPRAIVTGPSQKQPLEQGKINITHDNEVRWMAMFELRQVVRQLIELEAYAEHQRRGRADDTQREIPTLCSVGWTNIPGSGTIPRTHKEVP